MSDLVRRIQSAEPQAIAGTGARESARRAAMGALGAARPRRRRRVVGITFAIAATTIAATLAALLTTGVIGGGGDAPSRIVLPGDDVPPARRVPQPAPKPGIAATIVFRPASGVSEDDAYAQMVRVIRARAATRKVAGVRIERVERDRALVTLTGTHEPVILQDVVAGSSVAVYDLDDVLEGTFNSFRKAVLRARELAPGAPAQFSYLFRNGRLVRGPAPKPGDLRRLTATLPAGSQILGMPEGYTILRRQWAPDAAGIPVRLRSTQFFVVRDLPAVPPLEVLGAERPTAPTTTNQIPATTLELTADGRRAWDDLLDAVSARAADVGRPQRIAVTVNGDIEQIVVADPSGGIDAPPGSPSFGGYGIGGNTGLRLVRPVSTSFPQDGSIPATVWIADTYRVGPAPAVLGEKVEPLPPEVRRHLRMMERVEPVDPPSVRRALIATGPDGEWSVWNYLLKTGTPRGVVLGPRRDDGFGFGCARTEAISDCGGSAGFHLFAVPAGTRTLRFTSPGGSAREAAAGNGWALVLGARRTRPRPPGAPITAEALGPDGRVLARDRASYSLP